MKKMVLCGLGYISERVAKGCVAAKNMELYGLVSSNSERAKEYQERFQVEKIFTTYEEMFADKQVDVAYLATPNHVHYDQIMACLDHGIHVICEKPMVATKEEVQALFAHAKQKNCFLMEAEKTFFSDLLMGVKAIIDAGEIGELRHIEADYHYDIRAMKYPTSHWVFQKNGGVALDIGVYPICFAHYFAQADVKSHTSIKKYYEDYTCEFFYQSMINYKNHISAVVKADWLQLDTCKGIGYLYGTKGYIKVPQYWKDNKASIYNQLGELVKEIEVQFESDFTGEIEHVADCLTQGLLQSPILSEEISLEILRVMQ